MAYKYQRVEKIGGTSTTSAQVNYNISPDFGTPIFPGDTVTITGEAYSIKDEFSWTIRSVGFELQDYGIRAWANVSIAAGRWGTFSMTFTVPESGYEKLTTRWKYTEKNMSVTLYPLPDCTPGSSNVTIVSLPNNNESPEKLLLAKYRLTPQILTMDFERATIEGEWANDGLYFRCRTLKIAKNSQAVVDDITKATITCIGRDSASIVTESQKTVELTREQIVAALTTEGYSETVPGIFADFVTMTGLDYTLTLTLGDDYDQTSYADGVMRSFARLHLSGAKRGGVAIGMFSSSTDDKPKFEVAYDHESFFYGGIYGVTNYMEGEVATGGHWIDGKPIYRLVKNITAKTPSMGTNAGSWTSYPFFTDKLPNDILFSYVASLDTNTSISNGNKIPYHSGWSYSLDYYFVMSTGEFEFVKGTRSSAAAATYPLRVIVWYTKSDTAVPASDPAAPEGPEIFDEEPYADAGVARADYIGMMANINVPIDDEIETSFVESEVASSPNGGESPSIDEPTVVHSKKFDMVKLYYDAHVWNKQMVKDAVDKWITQDEYNSIIGSDIKK